MTHEGVHYVPLPHDVEEGKDSAPPTQVLSSPHIAVPPMVATKPLHHWEWATRGALLLISAVFFTLWLSATGGRTCTYVTKYSPANEAIEYLEHVKYKGYLHFTTPWRGDESGVPGPEIDAAWRRITTDVKPMRITEGQLQKMGMVTTPSTVRFPEEEGGGYLSSLEVTHHLQCLDMLRKATYREHYESFDPLFQGDKDALMNHLDMCVDIIRQAMMCYPDLVMVSYYWVHAQPFPFGDSNTIHRCKNFEKILEWATEQTGETITSGTEDK
ncbi:hypothetical protein BS17DRAFT_810874 [Gyrodon lividus]|nr:hypothetical protein BS17DRAFT_810874 [Gyrodon lividus]